MNSRQKSSESNLRELLEGLKALYVEGIELLKTDPGEDFLVDCAERLRPLMARIQSATETVELQHPER